MKKKNTFTQTTMFIICTIVFPYLGMGQHLIFEENCGVPASNITIDNYTGWQNQVVLYTGDGTCDLRTSNESSGYTTASGGGNVMINNNTKWFQISQLNTLDYADLQLRLGVRKSTTAENGNNLHVEVSQDSLTWSRLQMNDSLPVGTGTTGWHYVSFSSLPACSNLHIKFSNTGTGDFRIDDIKITTSTPITSPQIVINTPLHSGVYVSGIQTNIDILNFVLGTDGSAAVTISGNNDSLVTILSSAQELISFNSLFHPLQNGNYLLTVQLLNLGGLPITPPVLLSHSFTVVSPTVANPVISPQGGIYYQPQLVSLTTVTDGASILYTLDGSSPLDSGIVYSQPFTISEHLMLSAVAIKNGMNNSEISTEFFYIRDTNAIITLPFDISTNSENEHNDITLINGIIGNGLGNSYADGGAKFESSNAGTASLTLHFDSLPDKLCFDVRGRESGSSPQAYSGIQFNIYESSDNENWSLITSLNENSIGIENYTRFDSIQLNRNSRYVKWLLQEATKGNTQLNNIAITKLDITGITSFTNDFVTIYPNPTSNMIHVDCPQSQLESVEILSLLGKVIESYSVQDNHIDIALSDYPSGIYLMRIKCTTGVITKKVIKQ